MTKQFASIPAIFGITRFLRLVHGPLSAFCADDFGFVPPDHSNKNPGDNNGDAKTGVRQSAVESDEHYHYAQNPLGRDQALLGCADELMIALHCIPPGTDTDGGSLTRALIVAFGGRNGVWK